MSLKGEGRKVSAEVAREDVTVVKEKMEPLFGVERPFFHVDLADAVDVAVRDAKMADEKERARCTMSDSADTSSTAS